MTIDKIDKNEISKTLEKYETLGNPLELDPGDVGYTDVMDMYIKLIKASRDLIDSFRKLKEFEVQLDHKKEARFLRDAFAKAISGKSLEKLRELFKSGKFDPANLIMGTMYGKAITEGDINAANKLMNALAEWDSEGQKELRAPQITVKLNLKKDEYDDDDVIDVKNNNSIENKGD